MGGNTLTRLSLTNGLVVGVEEDSDDVAHRPLFAVGFPKSSEDLFLAATRNCDKQTQKFPPGSIIGPGGVVPAKSDIGTSLRQSPAHSTGARGEDLHLVVPDKEES